MAERNMGGDELPIKTYECVIHFTLCGDGAHGPVDEKRDFTAEASLPYMALDAAFQKLLAGLDFRVKLHSADKK
jgi:hypothetical protein